MFLCVFVIVIRVCFRYTAQTTIQLKNFFCCFTAFHFPDDPEDDDDDEHRYDLLLLLIHKQQFDSISILSYFFHEEKKFIFNLSRSLAHCICNHYILWSTHTHHYILSIKEFIINKMMNK